MTFLEFTLYYIGANLIYTALATGLYYLQVKYVQYRVKKMMQNGSLQVMTMEEFLQQQQDDGKKSWN